jgi:hypothetical protein
MEEDSFYLTIPEVVYTGKYSLIATLREDGEIKLSSSIKPHDVAIPKRLLQLSP